MVTGGHLGFKPSESGLGMTVESTEGVGDGEKKHFPPSPPLPLLPLTPDARPLGTFEIKMTVSNAKRSISTTFRRDRGL